jgi:hypothetical protein
MCGAILTRPNTPEWYAADTEGLVSLPGYSGRCGTYQLVTSFAAVVDTAL